MKPHDRAQHVKDARMSLSYAEAVAAVTAPGERFETGTIDIGGVATTVFVNGPNSLRDVFATARPRGEATFLVYEDERWSFADVMARVDVLGALLVDSYGVRVGDRVADPLPRNPAGKVVKRDLRDAVAADGA